MGSDRETIPDEQLLLRRPLTTPHEPRTRPSLCDGPRFVRGAHMRRFVIIVFPKSGVKNVFGYGFEFTSLTEDVVGQALKHR